MVQKVAGSNPVFHPIITPNFWGLFFLTCEQHKEYYRKLSIRILSVSNNINLFFTDIIDGMDVLIISYTAPIISLSMNFSSQELRIVFSSGVLGMAIGALILAPLADKIGRRKIILISIIIISLSVIITALSSSLYEVVILRFLSGLGIGSMLATTVSVVSEYTPSKSKEFWISFILAGYPIGAILALVFYQTSFWLVMTGSQFF